MPQDPNRECFAHSTCAWGLRHHRDIGHRWGFKRQPLAVPCQRRVRDIVAAGRLIHRDKEFLQTPLEYCLEKFDSLGPTGVAHPFQKIVSGQIYQVIVY